MTKCEKILRAIKKACGMRHNEIIRFIVEGCDGRKYCGQADRGVWATNLYGSSYNVQRPGLLKWYCTRKDDGKWHVTEPIVGPFLFKMRGQKSKTWYANMSRMKQKSYSKVPSACCKNCNQVYSRYNRIKITHDGKACIHYTIYDRMSHNNAETKTFDCIGRRWIRSSKYAQWKHHEKSSIYDELVKAFSR